MPAERELDGVQLAVLTNRFEGVVRAMMNTIARTGRSGVLNTARDFSCCILTREHELLVTAESLPIHVMSGPDLMSRSIFELHPDARPGDAFLHNSPYHGNSHPADHCILIPVFDEQERHRFTVLAKAHQADCGNAVPTTYVADARDVYEEGALIMPAVKVQSDYRDVEDVIRMLRLRIRVPDQWRGDYLALLGAARIGERRVLELAAEVGWDTLDSYGREWFDYSEQRMRAAIEEIPTGRTSTISIHDPFPGAPDGIPIKSTVDVRHDPPEIEVDLRENPDCLPCGLNLTEATAGTAAMIGVFNSLQRPVPPNAGAFRCLRIHLRENCVAGIPIHPTSCSVATTNVADRVTSSVQRALAELGDGIGMAEGGAIQPPAMAVISGKDADGEPFVNQLFLAITGGAAAPRTDAWLNILHVGNAGMMLRDSVEIDEIRHPVRIHAQYILRDTEGAGRQRGAPGAYAEFGPVDTPFEVVWLSDGSRNPALGARGGLAGAPAGQLKRELDGSLTELEPCDRVVLQPGESIVSLSSGGGGYGSPLERAPEAVQHDVVEGWVDRERASAVYGVVVGTDGELDLAATDALRAGTSV